MTEVESSEYAAGADSLSDDGSSPEPKAAKPRNWFRRHRAVTWIGAFIVSGALICGGLIGWVQLSARDQTYTVQSVPQRPVALVFGAGLNSQGKPSPYLAARLDDAAALYQAGKVKAILASGDNSQATYDEPSAMRDYLVSKDVPTDVIVLDYAGFDTHDTCIRAHEVFGVDAAILVTQDYHLPRALFSCGQAGIDSVGVGSPAIGGPILEYKARESIASLKAVADALLNRSPTYLGDPEPGIADVLGHQ